VSRLLLQHQDAIIRSWEARVTLEHHNVKLTGLALRDDVPDLLRELAGWLASGGASETSLVAARALAHVMQRLDVGLSLTQVFREYRLLREILIEQILGAEADEQERAGTQGNGDREARIAELARLNAGLDVVLSQSIEQFVEVREQRAAAELARAAQVYEESEVRYRSLFESIEEGFCIIELR
jgi:PAS domain-containing protein